MSLLTTLVKRGLYHVRVNRCSKVIARARVYFIPDTNAIGDPPPDRFLKARDYLCAYYRLSFTLPCRKAR